jgi:hypothetical protein
VLSRLFRRLFLEQLTALHAAGCLQFFGDHARLSERGAFTAYLAPLRRAEWIVYSKRPFGGPEAVLAYLSLYTHRCCARCQRPSNRHAAEKGGGELPSPHSASDGTTTPGYQG